MNNPFTTKVAKYTKKGLSDFTFLYLLIIVVPVAAFLFVDWSNASFSKLISVHEAVFKAISTFGSWLIVAITYLFAKCAPDFDVYLFGIEKNRLYLKLKPYLATVLAVLFISFVLWFYYGTDIEDGHEFRGGGRLSEEFNPTERERNTYGLRMFLIFLVPALLGTCSSLAEKAIADSKKSDSDSEDKGL